METSEKESMEITKENITDTELTAKNTSEPSEVFSNADKNFSPSLKKLCENKTENNSTENVGRNFTDTFKTILSSVLKTDLGQVLKNRSDKSFLNKINLSSQTSSSKVASTETIVNEAEKGCSTSVLNDDAEEPSKNLLPTESLLNKSQSESQKRLSSVKTSVPTLNDSLLESELETSITDKSYTSKESNIDDSSALEDDIDITCADSESSEQAIKANKARKSVGKSIEDDKSDDSKSTNASTLSDSFASTPVSGLRKSRNYRSLGIINKSVNNRTGKRKMKQFKGGTYPLSIRPKRKRKKNERIIPKFRMATQAETEGMDVDQNFDPRDEFFIPSESDKLMADDESHVVDKFSSSNLSDVCETSKAKVEVPCKENAVEYVPEHNLEKLSIKETTKDNLEQANVKEETKPLPCEKLIKSVVIEKPDAQCTEKKENVENNFMSIGNKIIDPPNEHSIVKSNIKLETHVDGKAEKPSANNVRTLSPANSDASEFHLEMSASSRTSVSVAGEDFDDILGEEESEIETLNLPPPETKLSLTKNEDAEFPLGRSDLSGAPELAKEENNNGENTATESNIEGNTIKEENITNTFSSMSSSHIYINPLKPRMVRLRDASGKFSRGIPPESIGNPEFFTSENAERKIIRRKPVGSASRRRLSGARPRKFTFFRNRRRLLLSGRRKPENKEPQQFPVTEEAILPEDSTIVSSVPEVKEFPEAMDEDEVFSESSPGEGRMSVALSVKRRHGLKKKQEEDDFERFSSPWENFEPLISQRAKKVSPSSNLNEASLSILPDDYEKPSIQLCTCQENCTPEETPILKDNYCQAIDCIDDRLVGCCNLVARPLLNRPSRTIPFVAMCEVHRFRLQSHHCCPGCGFFCTQGPFVKCSGSEDAWHLFHERCCLISEGEALCPHCASMSDWIHVRLRINGIRPAVFYPKQQHMNKQPSARMTITRGSEFPALQNEKDESSKSYKIFQTGKEISVEGLPLGPDRAQLESLLVNLALEKPMNLRYTIKSMYNAAKSNDVEKILHMLAMGFDINHKFEEHENETAFHAAAGAGHLVIAHVLHQAGASLDALDNKLRTPLMIAVENKQSVVVQYLIRAGVNLETRGEDGMTVLHLASKAGNLDACQMILGTGKININIQDDGGWTPVVWAAEHRHKEIARFFLESGSDPNIRDNEQNIALHWAAFSGSIEICEMLLNRGCDVTSVNEHGDTPLHIAARQDNYDCVILFLARNAEIDVKNKENEMPLNCCPDENSITWMALSMNLKLKRFAQARTPRSEVLLHKDISRGNEPNPIPCVNGFDDEMFPTDYLYIIENCETSPINVDRSITSLQSCHCEEDCSTINCTCSSLSLKCWYTREGGLIPEFNLLDPPMIFECNRACRCWKNCNNRVVQQGIACRLQLFRTYGKGWGVRTLRDIPRGTFICEYIGEVISDSEADHREDDSYLFDLDNRDGETYCIDARHYGNISRFINHLCEPNLVPVKVFIDHQDLRYPRIAFFSSRDIKAYEELGFDYGEKFWIIKYKTFTCMCDSDKCKYSADKIQEMIENYMRRQKEEVES